MSDSRSVPIVLEYLSTIQGDAKVTVEDDDPKERANLAQVIKELLEKGHAVFIEQGSETRRVKGYDPDKNEWIVAVPPSDTYPVRRGRGRPRKNSLGRLPGRPAKVTVVPPIAGG